MAGIFDRLRGHRSNSLKTSEDAGSASSSPRPLELARGNFEQLVYEGGVLHAWGWMMVPGRSLHGFEVELDGKSFGPAEALIRDDVHAAFPGFPEARSSGFRLALSLPPAEVEAFRELTVFGIIEGERFCKLGTAFRAGFADGIPLPPEHLMTRVSNTSNPVTFRCGAVMAFGQFQGMAKKHRGDIPIRKALDWGCGVGRVTSYFLQYTDVTEIHGCDIDEESIAWCQANLKKGTFRVIKTDPPTPYPDGTFDIVTGYSVFTHLSRKDQRAWLQELQRILAPEGLCLVSIHGEFAARFSGDKAILSEIRQHGISDRTFDPNLDGIAPKGYYRGVFQTREYTERTWSEFFEILEIQERGVGHYQDMVVLRKRAKR